jgi:hypothetical protein
MLNFVNGPASWSRGIYVFMVSGSSPECSAGRARGGPATVNATVVLPHLSPGSGFSEELQGTLLRRIVWPGGAGSGPFR